MARIRVTIAHSSDADDAFMFYALAKGKVPTGKYEVTHVLKDIETLNKAAEKGTYEVTALSYHQVPYVARDYALLTTGGSYGEGYGPVLIAKRNLSKKEELSRMTVVIPGERTTAALALRLWLPGVKTALMPFDRIQDAVKSGEVEAGVIIHEGQLNFSEQGLTGVVDLGAWWRQETQLPLPLGGNGVRKDLGWVAMGEIGALIRASIDYALAHRADALDYALAFGRGLERRRADRFVGMYVNERTRECGPEGKKAIRALLDRAHASGLIPARVPLEFVETPAAAGRKWP